MKKLQLYEAWKKALVAAVVGCAGCASTEPIDNGITDPAQPEEIALADTVSYGSGRNIFADVVAINQIYVYNRFGSFNPAGLIYALRRDVVPADPSQPIGPGNATLRPGKRPRPLVLRVDKGDYLTIKFTNWLSAPTWNLSDDLPATRSASIHVNGLEIQNIDALGANAGADPNSLARPGETRIYSLFADKEGPFLMHSTGAMAGGEGDGGQIVLGLFGVINVEPPGAVAYRSQVTSEELAAATLFPPNPDGTPRIDYDAIGPDGEPILRMTNDAGEIVHNDLTAIIAGYSPTRPNTPATIDTGSFREFTIVFHDELKAVQAFPELDDDPSFHGVRDAFGINYGSAGLGAELLANRAKIGPSRNCTECKFEEFFLSSWANGDPAMVVDRDHGVATRALYPDDPSNVYHGYQGDPTWFRNVHAGPKETHVFHLHAHQWPRTPGNDNSTFLDAQTIGPGGAFTYEILYGGGGNRNLTPGDAIFHCHLYPHFASGMWGLWRNHDVFEAGTPDRRLPDGEIPEGTPTPAVVPLPGRGMAPMPTYGPTQVRRLDGTEETRPPMPGYPFYIGAIAGHRPSQAPLDIENDGGLPRHLILNATKAPNLDPNRQFEVVFLDADIKLLPNAGTPLEVSAEAYHAGAFPGGTPFTTPYGFPAKAYPALTPEGLPSQFVVNGQPPVPGAPYADPCPIGTPERVYRVDFVQLDGVINRAGWHDPQMRIAVLEQDVEATLSGARPPEPLFFRANSGECVVDKTTNLIPEALAEDAFQIFTPTDIIGAHIHLVKFDVTSSDGSANGFNYEDGAFAAGEVRQLINAANVRGGAFAPDGALGPVGARIPLAATLPPALPFAPPGVQTTIQRWWADSVVNNRGEDRALRTSFTHDHFSPSSHQHHGLYAGLVVEPRDSTWRDPETGQLFGTRADGGPTSWRADILPPPSSPKRPYREFNLAIADFAIVYDECGNPVNPPGAAEAPLPIAIEHEPTPPEVISADDPGTQLMNYRNEPIPLRIARRRCINGQVVQKDGPEGEMHNVFSSVIHGDPFTPILRMQEGDPFQVHLLQGAQEEQHVFTMHGARWLKEIADPDSGQVNAQAIGISEHFEFETVSPTIADPDPSAVVDQLYQSAPTDDLWDGVWGLARTQHQGTPGLLPLPGAVTPPQNNFACPADAPERRYVVHAIPARGNLPFDRLIYNKEADLYDPDAIIFVRENDLDEVRRGVRAPEPLVLRAAAGECIKVTLVNELPLAPTQAPHWNYSAPIIDGFNTNQVRPSNNVSLHPQLVTYDIRRDDGANVGLNPIQTVPPGGVREYSWYAGAYPNPDQLVNGAPPWPVEFGSINLRDMADVVTHGMHGAVGSLIVEPLGAVWDDDPGTHAESTVLFYDSFGNARSFREFVMLFQDEIGMRSDQRRFQCKDAELNCGTAIRNIYAVDDSEESGHKAFNYRTEPFWARLGIPPETPENEVNNIKLGEIFSSAVFGDPETPIFTASTSQELRVRQLYPSGHRRQNALTLWGASWPHNPWQRGSRSTVLGVDPLAIARGTEDGIGPMVAHDILPFQPAGGLFRVPGDRLYLNQGSFKLPDGLWGIIRVTP